MITEPATVVRVGDDAVWVRCEAQQDCRRCAEGRGCGGGILGRLLGDRLRLVRAGRSGMDLRVGDGVVIALAESALLRASFVMYLAPLLAMIAGAMLFRWLAGTGDLWAIGGGVSGLVVGLWHARRFGRLHRSDSRYHPSVIGRLDGDSLEACPIVVSPHP